MKGTGLLAVVLLALLAWACRPGEQEASLEARAQALERGLICPVCPGETLDQSQASLAKQMRDFLREKLQEGWTEEQVLQYFVERYGEGVLAAPPGQGVGLLAWVFPPVAVAIGLLVLLGVVRAMSRRPAQAAPPPAQGGEEDLSLVEREREGGTGAGRPEG